MDEAFVAVLEYAMVMASHTRRKHPRRFYLYLFLCRRLLCMCLSSTGTLASPNPHLILTLTLTLTLSFTGTLVSFSLRRTFQRLRVRFSVASDGGVRPNHGVQRLETTENHLRDERREREGNEKEQEGTQKKGKVLKVSWMGHHNILGSKRAWIIN